MQLTTLSSNPKLAQLAKSMDEVNPDIRRGPMTTKQSDVFEI
jgi:hypothetical protein